MTARVIHVLSNIPGILSCLVKRELPLSYKMIIEPTHKGPLSEHHLKELNTAEILIADPILVAENKLSQSLPNLVWMMSTWAGVDSIMKTLDKDKQLPQYTLTRFGGVYGQHMAEFVIGSIIAQERNFRGMQKDQEQSVWDREKFMQYRILPQLQIGILGAGDIGKDIAKACKNLGMTVWGMTNRPVKPEQRCSFIDHHRVFLDLPEILQSCDYLCCVLPSTPQTRNMLSGNVLSQCKKKPVLINIGRGDLINESSLINALNEGWISHSVLDVSSTEPLPNDSLLWTAPGVTITPHVSAVSFDWQVAEKFEEMFKKFEANEKIDFIVDWENGY